jgi:hypothetical protein
MLPPSCSFLFLFFTLLLLPLFLREVAEAAVVEAAAFEAEADLNCVLKLIDSAESKGEEEGGREGTVKPASVDTKLL